MIRLMDDIYLVSDDDKSLADDFQVIQRLMGDKGLSIKPQKTRVDDAGHAKIDSEIDEVKRSLLKRRRMILTVGYDEDGSEIITRKMIKRPLSKKEIGYIDRLLEKSYIEEE